MAFSLATIFILAILQGLTEFLPVSSSAHLIIFSWLIEGKALPMHLNVAFHIGTLLAVILYFYKDWLLFLQCLIPNADPTLKIYRNRYLPALLLGSLPAGVLGVFGKDWIELWFHNPQSVVLPLAIVGIAMYVIDKRSPSLRTMDSLTFKDALAIGIAQAFALIPGVSRSGATVSMGRHLGFHKRDAARFSFLLGTPAMGGAFLVHLPALLPSMSQPSFYVAVGVSFLTGCAAIKLFLEVFARSGFKFFAIYRLLLAAGILVMLFLNAGGPSG